MSDASQIVLPKFCDFYKYFLIEEVLGTHPASSHYGYLKFIGFLEDNINPVLLSIGVSLKESDGLKHPSGDGEYSIPLILLNKDKLIRYQTTVEVYGELMFKKVTTVENDWSEEVSSKDLVIKLKEYLTSLESITQLMDDTREIDSFMKTKSCEIKNLMEKCYKPVIKVHFLNEISNAKELIAGSLFCRCELT